MFENTVIAALLALGWALAGYFAYRRPQQFVAQKAEPTPSLQATFHDDSLFFAAPSGLCQLALDGRVLRANRQLQLLCGCDEQKLTAQFFSELFFSEEIERVAALLNNLLADHRERVDLQGRIVNARGHMVWTRVGITLCRNSRGQPAHFVAAIDDSSEQKLTDQLLHDEFEKIKLIADQVPVAIWMWSPGRQLIFVNSAQERLSGRPKESFYANPRSFLELIHPDDVERVAMATRANRGETYELTYRILRDDGELRYIRELGKNIYDACGELRYHIASAMDISSEMIVRDELHDLNSRLRETNLRLCESVRLDGLTRCLNRTALFDEAEKSLLLERRYSRSSTLVFFDLNNFKEVNDTFGHYVGDRGLVAFAEQIKARLRTTDELGRYGGDEFVALLRETDADQALQLLATLTPVVIDGEDGSSIILRFSAGVACSNEEGIETVDDWLRIADSYMYSQKVRSLREGGARG